MKTYEFHNMSKESLGFRIYERFSWKSGATLVLKVADATPVSVLFDLQTIKKQASNLQELNTLVRGLQTIIMNQFPEGSTGYSISFVDPKQKPEVIIKLPSTFMEVGDEMTFTAEAKNLEGKLLAFIKEQEVAKVLKDGKTIKAIAPGTCNLRVGTKEFSREIQIKVEPSSLATVDKVDVPEVEKDADVKMN